VTETDTRPVPSQAGAEGRAVLRYSPVMTDSDKDSGNQRKPWSPEDWRLLIITFAGGLGSIVIGAAVLGLAVALARYEHPPDNASTWFFDVALPIVLLIGWVWWLRERNRKWYDYLGLYLLGVILAIVILTWIGVAAGIK
jgi:hypothetical protein